MLDALAQVGGVEAQFQHPPGRRRGCGLAAHRLPGGVEHFQGALGAHRISRGDFGGGRGVGGLQQGVADVLAQDRELLAQLRLGCHGRRLKATGEGLEIQTAAAHQQRHAPLLQSGVDARGCDRLKLLEGDRLIGRAQVQQMVRHPRLLLRRGLGGSDVHLPIELAGIHVDHRQIQPFGDVQRQGGFAAGGGPEQGDHQGVGAVQKGEGGAARRGMGAERPLQASIDSRW